MAYNVTTMATPHTTPVTIPLVQKLVGRQNAGNCSDYEFARKLGVHRLVWYATRIGQRGIGPTLIGAVLRTYPDLTDDVLAFLRDGSREEG